MEQARALPREQSKELLQLYSKLNSLSPIDRLPSEIKTEIFHNALLSEDFHGEDLPVTPFFLGKICQGWRNFVWSCPVLWTIIHLCLSKRRYESQTNLLREWLSRTAGCALSIHLTLVDSEPWQIWTPEPPKEILVAFASVSTQWKEVEFFILDNRDYLDAISVAKTSLPLLTTATVGLLGPVNSVTRKIDLFSMAPQLSALHLYPGFYLDTVTAPWHQLREFSHSESSTVDEIREFLHKAPNIVRCSFNDIDSAMLNSKLLNLDLFDRSPMLEYLEYLEFSFCSVNTKSTRILGPVKLPSLREISLSGPFDSSLPILNSIMTSFHSSPLLEKFTLGGSISSDHDLIRVLEKIPSIRDLCLSFHAGQYELLTNELLQRLCPPHENMLLPNLRSLTYDGPTTLNYHMHLLRDVLVYRFRQSTLHSTELHSESRTSQIRSVTVITADKLDIGPDIQHDLDTLVREGLALSLTSTWTFRKPRFVA
ncbi:hypothetical protein K443DRAFT_4514 [Laccaria amethystina LaAM-08-1]|uniref:F-box domain-containing protein n=1 Tax=Laccaria amethystina LaAM-08-1 TaxID=1095629 RepID=A0A0C9XSB4_9AGAR|nr:hypothetical protein K443DRAFT_4514 [Laccaria amethystina LaAM-08-1]